MKKQRNILMVTGISGSGKSTLFDNGDDPTLPPGLVQLDPKRFEIAISCTTRPPRLGNPGNPGETNGIHYHFLTREEFLKQDMIESVEFNENLYGVQASEFERIPKEKDILLVVEPNGALQIAKYIKNNNIDLNIILIHMGIPLSVIKNNLFTNEILPLQEKLLATDGYSEEAEKIRETISEKKKAIEIRLGRGNINEDLKKLLPEMKEYNLEVDLPIKVLNKDTSESVYQWYLINRYL